MIESCTASPFSFSYFPATVVDLSCAPAEEKIGGKCSKRDFDELCLSDMFSPSRIDEIAVLFRGGVFSESGGVGAALVWLFPCKKQFLRCSFWDRKVM